MPGVVGDADTEQALPTRRDLPRQLGGDMLHGKQGAWFKSMCFDIPSNGTNRYQMLPDTMRGGGPIITSVVCRPAMHSLHPIRGTSEGPQLGRLQKCQGHAACDPGWDLEN